MIGVEFFMHHAGWAIQPEAARTGDAIEDFAALSTSAIPLYTGSSLRFSSFWMVVTPTWKASSFKFKPELGFLADAPRNDYFLKALKSGDPCLIVQTGKRTLSARDLFVTRNYLLRASEALEVRAARFNIRASPWGTGRIAPT